MCLLLCSFHIHYVQTNYEDSARGLLSGPAILLEASVPNLPGFFATWLNLIREEFQPHASHLRVELKEVGDCWKPGTQLCV